MELYQLYNPITATPFQQDQEYQEFEPCDALKPFIRCFWGTKEPIMKKVSDTSTTGIVTPDTCMDIIYTVDFTHNKLNNTFCGIDERTFQTHNFCLEDKMAFSFAIRFYAWGVPMFSEESMRTVKNASFDVGYHFSKIKKEIEPLLFNVTDMRQLIPQVEQILLKHLKERHNQNVLESIYYILLHKGNISIQELKQQIHLSDRQLERLFLEYVGVSPKSMASMIRYQYLWNDIVYRPFYNILDLVDKYGYSDQAHLCHDFKKYHSMNIAEARTYALQNVGNIQ